LGERGYESHVTRNDDFSSRDSLLMDRLIVFSLCVQRKDTFDVIFVNAERLIYITIDCDSNDHSIAHTSRSVRREESRYDCDRV